VLDVGCGTGSEVLELARALRAGSRSVGVDASLAMVEEARRRAAAAGVPAEFHVGDAHRLPFPDDSFDAARANRVFHDLDAPAALAEMVRVCKPGGVVAIAEPEADTFVFDLPGRALTRRLVHFLTDGFRSGWIARQLPARFREAGLEDVRWVPAALALPFPVTEGFRGGFAAAVEAGVVTAAEFEAWWAQLAAAHAEGRFVMAAMTIRTRGRKPR
jgi:SAM-dependent methyltransferase